MKEKSLNVLELGRTPLLTVLMLAWPIIIEQFLLSFTQYADAAMVGSLGASATASVGVCSSALFLVKGVLTGVAMGFSVQVAQAIGADDLLLAKRVIKQAMFILTWSIPILIVFAGGFSYAIPRLMGAEPDVIEQATVYMFVVGCAWPGQLAMLMYGSILRCRGDTKNPLLYNIIANIANIILNWLFIYEPTTLTLFGRTFSIWRAGLGVFGAALATALSTVIAGVLMWGKIMAVKNELKVPMKECYYVDKPVLKRAVSLGLPISLERGMRSCGQLVVTAIITGFGTVAIAAHHLAITAESISYMPGYGFADAATTLIGQSVGAKRKEDGVRFGYINMAAALVSSLLMSIILYVFAGPILSIFTQDAEVLAIGVELIHVIAFFQPLLALNLTTNGILRGAGDTRYPFWVTLIGEWGVRVTLCLLFTRVFHLGLTSVWYAFGIDFVIRAILTTGRFVKQKWTHVFD